MARIEDRSRRNQGRTNTAVVWHGFTQMSAYADNAPVVVERAEGHELIDVDGNRYLDAISSLWVNTLGHRVPELDDALRDQLDRVAHSTMLGNGNRVVVELAEALAARRARRRAALPVRVRRRRRGRAGAEDRVPVLGRTGASTGAPRTSPSAAPTTATPSARSRSATAASAPTLFDPLRFPVLRAPRFADPDCFDAAVAHGRRARRASWRRWSSSRWCRARPACSSPRPTAFARARRRVPRARRAADLRRGGDRLRPHRHAVRVRAVRAAARPAVPRQGAHRRLPAACRRRSRAAGCSTRSSAPTSPSSTLYHGHSYSGNALAAAVALRHLELLDEWRRARQRARALGRAPRAARRPRRAARRRSREVRLHGLMGGVELAPPTRRVCAGAGGCARPPSSAACCSARSATSSCSCRR